MKHLNEDILRISKLMGFEEKKVISEQAGVFRFFGLGDDLVELLEKNFDRQLEELTRTEKISKSDARTIRDMVSNAETRSVMSRANTLDEIAQSYINRSGGTGLTPKAEQDAIRRLTGVLEKFNENSNTLIKNFTDQALSKETVNGVPNRFIDIFNHARNNMINRLRGAADDEFDDLQDIKSLFRKQLEETDLIDNFPEMIDALVSRLETDSTFRQAARDYESKFKTPPDFINTPPLGQNINKTVGNIPTLVNVPGFARIVQGFQRFYIGYIKRAQAIIPRMWQPTIEKGAQIFDAQLKAAFDEVLQRGGSDADILNIYKLRITQSFFEVGRLMKDGVNYKALWDELRANVNDSYTGKDLADVNKFLDELETYGGKKDWYISIKTAIDQLSGGKSGDAFEEFSNKIADAQASVMRKGMDDVAKKEIPSFWKRLLSYYGTGSWGTPKEMMKYFISKGYRKKSLLGGIIVRFFILNVALPILLMGAEALWDSVWIKIAEESDSPWLKSKAVGLVGEEAGGKTNYWKEWVVNGVTSELSNDSFWGQITRIFPGFIDDTILIISSFVVENIGKNVTDEQESSIEDANKDIKDQSYTEKVLEISEIKLGEPSTGDALPGSDGSTVYQNLRRTINADKNFPTYSNSKKYFRFQDKDDDRTFYFFMKDDPSKKLTLRETNIYASDMKHITGKQLVGIDETGKKYEGNEINNFTKNLISLIDSGKILSPKEFMDKFKSLPKELKNKFKNKIEEVLNGGNTSQTNEQITEPTSQKRSIDSIINKLIKEMEEGKKFGEDNFKHWKDTFKFKKYDEKTGQLKDVKITTKMDEIMDRIDHFRKKYDEDDSFVRAVIDVFGTGIDVIQYTKGLAHLTEGVIVEGLMGVLANIRESKELVTWTVKHYNDGNWELVKGNFNKKELLNVGKTKRERDERQKESDNPAEGLKKKEQESIMILNRDEKEGLNGLPTKIKEKVKEKLRQGWTTEKPFDFLDTYYTESEINSVFNDKIKIYKLKPSAEFFRTLAKNSSKITVKKGFCKSVKNAKGEYDLSEKEKNTLNHFISKCETKFGV